MILGGIFPLMETSSDDEWPRMGRDFPTENKDFSPEGEGFKPKHALYNSKLHKAKISRSLGLNIWRVLENRKPFTNSGSPVSGCQPSESVAGHKFLSACRSVDDSVQGSLRWWVYRMYHLKHFHGILEVSTHHQYMDVYQNNTSIYGNMWKWINTRTISSLHKTRITWTPSGFVHKKGAPKL